MQRNARAEKAVQKTGGREATGISEWCMKRVETSNGNEVKQAHKEAEMQTMESTGQPAVDTVQLGVTEAPLTLLKQQDHSVGAFDHAGRGQRNEFEGLHSNQRRTACMPAHLQHEAARSKRLA